MEGVISVAPSTIAFGADVELYQLPVTIRIAAR